MKIAILSLYSGLIDRGVETWTREVGTRLAEKHEVFVIQGGVQKNSKYQTFSPKLNIKWGLRSGENTLMQSLVWTYWLYINFVFTLKSLSKLHKFKPDIIIPTNGNWLMFRPCFADQIQPTAKRPYTGKITDIGLERIV